MAEMPKLTPREQEVVNCLLTGQSNKQIAEALGLALGSVEEHLTKIYRKYGVPNRVVLILKLCTWMKDQG